MIKHLSNFVKTVLTLFFLSSLFLFLRPDKVLADVCGCGGAGGGTGIGCKTTGSGNDETPCSNFNGGNGSSCINAPKGTETICSGSSNITGCGENVIACGWTSSSNKCDGGSTKTCTSQWNFCTKQSLSQCNGSCATYCIPGTQPLYVQASGATATLKWVFPGGGSGFTTSDIVYKLTARTDGNGSQSALCNNSDPNNISVSQTNNNFYHPHNWVMGTTDFTMQCGKNYQFFLLQTDNCFGGGSAIMGSSQIVSGPTCPAPAPTCSVSVDQTSVPINTNINAWVGSSTNANRTGIYRNPPSTWTTICETTGNCSGFTSFSTAGTYWVVCNAYQNADGSGTKCTGAPGTLPSGWTDCGVNSRKQITVTAPTTYCSINLPTPPAIDVGATSTIIPTVTTVESGAPYTINWTASSAVSPASATTYNTSSGQTFTGQSAGTASVNATVTTSNNQGFYRTVPVVNGNPNWGAASGWNGPINLDASFAGSGDIQASSDYVVGSTLWQTYWRANPGTCNGLTSITVNCNPNVCQNACTFPTTDGLGNSCGQGTCTNQCGGTINDSCGAPICQYRVSTSVTSGSGSFSPTSQTVNLNGAASFAVAPSAGYQIGNVTTDCPNGGNLSGNTYTTGTITSNCTVYAAFNPLNYFQTSGGDVWGNGNVDDRNLTSSYISLGTTNGGIVSANLNINSGGGKISQNGTTPGFNLTSYTNLTPVTNLYNTLATAVAKNAGVGNFANVISQPTCSTSTGWTTLDNKFTFYCYGIGNNFDTQLTNAINNATLPAILIPSDSQSWYIVSNPKPSLTGSKKIIIFVNGNLEVDQNIRVTSNDSGAVFIATGDFTVGSGVQYLDGIYIFPGTFSDAGSNQLTGNGSLLKTETAGSFNFSRNFSGGPAESWTYEPKYLDLFKKILSTASYTWKELPPQ